MRICGLDEVGRGALAGPLVAAAAALNSKYQITNLRDSKKLNLKQREELYEVIVNSGATIDVEIISAGQINNRGMGWANKQVFRNLIKRTDARKYIVDGNLRLGRINGKTKRIKSVIKADTTRKCVMAAAIVAKVTRDRLMRQLHKSYPQFGWDRNVGYGTKKHIEAIKNYGTVKYHRSVFVRTALKTVSEV